jgi:arylsulfatase A-like enzyme
VQTDFYLGQVMDALKAAKVDQDTIVVFCSDNGAEDPAVGNGQYNGWTGPWRGSYFTAMEGRSARAVHHPVAGPRAAGRGQQQDRA